LIRVEGTGVGAKKGENTFIRVGEQLKKGARGFVRVERGIAYVGQRQLVRILRAVRYTVEGT
jgi:hypothetical protein